MNSGEWRETCAWQKTSEIPRTDMAVRPILFSGAKSSGVLRRWETFTKGGHSNFFVIYSCPVADGHWERISTLLSRTFWGDEQLGAPGNIMELKVTKRRARNTMR